MINFLVSGALGKREDGFDYGMYARFGGQFTPEEYEGKSFRQRLGMEFRRIASDPELRAGFTAAMINDAVLLGRHAAVGLLASALFVLVGMEPPDDEQLLYVPGEWTVGGAKIKDAWILSDVCGPWIAIAASAHVFMNKDKMVAFYAERGFDLEIDPVRFLWAGLGEYMSNTVAAKGFEGLQFFMDAAGLIDGYEQDETLANQGIDPWYKIAVNAQGFALQQSSRLFEPRWLNNLLNDGVLPPLRFQRSATQVYAGEDGETRPTDWADAQIRRVTRNHWAAGLIMDSLSFGVSTFTGNSSGQPRTGYTRWEMPFVVKPDAMHAAFFDAYAIDDSMSYDEIASRVSAARELFAKYPTASALNAQGVCIPYTTSQAVSNMIQQEIDGIKKDIDLKGASGEMTWEEYTSWRPGQYDRIKLLRAEQDKVQNINVRRKPLTYYQEVGDWRERYYDSKGNPVTQFDYLQNHLFGDGTVNKSVYHAGTPWKNMVPFIIVSNDWGTFNAETKAAWATGDTDWQSVQDNVSMLESLLPGGSYTKSINKGKRVSDVILGSRDQMRGNNAKAAEGSFPLAGERGLVPVDPKQRDKMDFVRMPDYAGNGGRNLDKMGPAASGGALDAFMYGNAFGVDNGKDAGNNQTEEGRLLKQLIDQNKALNNGSPYSYKRTGGGSYYRSGGRYYRSGGSGGSYERNPSIYSHAPSSLNTDKPATMYSKTPASYARFDYLRPDVQTKGSREAYKRSDF